MPSEVIISKDEAVFWLDADGRWHNRHGPFEHKRIVDYFHRAIRWDADGFYLQQAHSNGVLEKVYFHYHDTALFVFNIQVDDSERKITLILNSGARLPLVVADLRVENDQLYVCWNTLRVKFTAKALVQVSRYLTFSSEDPKSTITLNF